MLIPDESCDGARQVAGEVGRELLTQGVSKCFLKETSKEKLKGVGRPKPPVVGGRGGRLGRADFYSRVMGRCQGPQSPLGLLRW